MYFKRTLKKLLPSLLLVFTVYALPLGAPFPAKARSPQAKSPPPAQSGYILIDKIAAVVNDEIITLTDIDKAIQFFPGFRKTLEREEEFYLRVLEDLINYKVV
jgi:hypothetical protein